MFTGGQMAHPKIDGAKSFHFSQNFFFSTLVLFRTGRPELYVISTTHHGPTMAFQRQVRVWSALSPMSKPRLAFLGQVSCIAGLTYLL